LHPAIAEDGFVLRVEMLLVGEFQPGAVHRRRVAAELDPVRLFRTVADQRDPELRVAGREAFDVADPRGRRLLRQTAVTIQAKPVAGDDRATGAAVLLMAGGAAGGVEGLPQRADIRFGFGMMPDLAVTAEAGVVWDPGKRVAMAGSAILDKEPMRI